MVDSFARSIVSVEGRNDCRRVAVAGDRGVDAGHGVPYGRTAGW